MSIGNLNSLMSTARSALQATQTALNETANNVANQNTPGYARRVISIQDSVTLSNVQAKVTTVRDASLDDRLTLQTQRASAADAKLTALSDLQSVFPLDTNGSSSLGNALDGLWNSFDALQADPSNTATRRAVLAAASNFASAINQSANQLNQQNAGIQVQIDAAKPAIDGLTTSIASLNQRIQKGQDTDGSLDLQRQNAVTQLASYVGFTITSTERGGISLTATNGAALVSGEASFAFDTSQTAGLTGGKIGGLVAVRDSTLGNAISALDTLAATVATQVNAQNAAGLDANGNPGSAIFSSPTPTTGFASRIAVVQSDPSQIASAAQGEGQGGNGNAAALSALRNAPNASGTSDGDFLGALLTEIGAQTARATTDSTTETTAKATLQSQRNAYSGVSLNEEAANLSAYQRAYQANAKVFAIADKLMAEAINLGQNTPVS